MSFKIQAIYERLNVQRISRGFDPRLVAKRINLRRIYEGFDLEHLAERLKMHYIKRFDLRLIATRLNVQRIRRRFSIIIGFLALLLLFAVNTLITRHLLDVQTADQAWVSHTQQVLAQVAQIQLLIANAETGQRGYIYTGDPSLLGPYDLAETQLDPNLQLLANLTIDNPQEQEQIAQLRLLIQTKTEMLSEAILLFQSGYPDNAKEMVVSERGRLLLAKINKSLTEIGSAESSLKSSGSAAYQASLNRTTVYIYVANCIVSIGLLFLAFHIRSEIRLRERRARGRLAREKWFRSVLTCLGHAIIATDTQGFVTFLNPQAERLMGIPLSQAKGQPIDKVFPLLDGATLEPVQNLVNGVIERGYSEDLERGAFLRNGNGNLFPIRDSATLIRDRNDKPLGAVLAFKDSTLAPLPNGFSIDGDSIAVPSALLTTASHKIDTPLVAACDLIYIAKLTDNMPTDALNLLGMAEGHLARVSHISREFLGYYRQSTPPEPIDLATLVDSVLEGFSNICRSKNITVMREFRQCPPVIGLSAELTQAVTNLVSNAVDAAPFGGTIRAQLSCPAQANSKALLLRIHDNGPGIEPADRVHLFEPFFTTKQGGGYGLGLWTSKGIVERHGGSIQITHEDGQSANGTAVNILLPIRAA